MALPLTGPAAEHQRRLVRAAQLAAEAPPLARVGTVRTGTAGWTDPLLVKRGVFYPRGCSSPEDRLRFYATQFALVEVDTSYYALPSPTMAQHWVERTPPGFTFDIKAYAALTGHPVELARLPRVLQDALPEAMLAKGRVLATELPTDVRAEIRRLFCTMLEPLVAAGRLGCVMLQFPPWFTATKANARVLEACRTDLGTLPLAVELRHATWGEPSRFTRVVDLLRAHAMSYVVVDEPQGLPNSMPPTPAVAHPKLALVRFNGRKGETWAKPGATVQEKFDWLYTAEELTPWALSIRELASQADEVHAVFNNCVSNQAVLNAKDLAALLAREIDGVAGGA